MILALLAAWFLHLSWRKWPDPIVDTGTQWYDAWRVSQGAAPFHDLLWNYGPLSLLFNGFLFRSFGAGMMVLVTATWGFMPRSWFRLPCLSRGLGLAGGFCRIGGFRFGFSFSILNGVGNYSFATPYTMRSPTASCSCW